MRAQQQVGNPPWVRPDWDEIANFAEHDTWWALTAKTSAKEQGVRRKELLADPDVASGTIYGIGAAASQRSFLSNELYFPELKGLRPDLYRCFMSATWRHASPNGTTGLVHPESHFTDENAGPLRAATYRHLRRHWQFFNELGLFEIDNHVSFGVHIYATEGEIRFKQASSLYHPKTVETSIRHDGLGAEPGAKDDAGRWNLSPHASRIIEVSRATLANWASVLGNQSVPAETKLLYSTSASIETAFLKIANRSSLRARGLNYALGFDETAERKAGSISAEWSHPTKWADVIIQGPHLFAATAFNKEPNPTLKSNRDWSRIDLEQMPVDFIPATAYKRLRNRASKPFVTWNYAGIDRASSEQYRVAWRSMAANRNERTLIAAIIPPGTEYLTQSIYALGAKNSMQERDVPLAAGILTSLLSDFLIRSAPKSSIPRSSIERLPYPESESIRNMIAIRALRLNCLSASFAELWNATAAAAACSADPLLEQLPSEPWRWQRSSAARTAQDRRQMQIEIDVLMSIDVGITADELCTIYRTQFAVLFGYDRNVYFYDANGRLVPNEVLKVWRQKQEAISEEERTATNTSGNTYIYELPFRTLDREADMRQAYAHFEKLLQDEA